MKFSLQPLLHAGRAALDLLYPPHCAACRIETPSGLHLCKACRNEATLIVAPFCQVCSEPFSGQVEGLATCSNCLEHGFHFDCAIAAYKSRGVVREMIHGFKYNRRYYLRHALADWLLENLSDNRLRAPFERIVPVPLHPARERKRGFNQSRALAEIFAKKTGAPMLDCLKRTRFTGTQTSLGRENRMENLRNAFSMRQSANVRNLHLILIDDIFTTGTTADECARVLKDSGAATVRVVTVARG